MGSQSCIVSSATRSHACATDVIEHHWRVLDNECRVVKSVMTITSCSSLGGDLFPGMPPVLSWWIDSVSISTAIGKPREIGFQLPREVIAKFILIKIDDYKITARVTGV